MNVVCLLGRLTADVELKKTGSGISVTSFSLAVSRGYKNEDGSYQTDFINCVAWRQTAEFISRYFRKGQMIGLSGAIQTRQYQDNGGDSRTSGFAQKSKNASLSCEHNGGKNRTAFEVVVSNAYFAGSKADSRADQDKGYRQRQYGRPDIAPSQQSFIPARAPRWESPAGFEPISDTDGDLPF